MIYKILVFSFFLFLLPVASQAGFLDRLPNSSCLSVGNCSLNDVVSGLVSLINLLLGAIGAAALLYFFWGGIRWMTSFGSADRVKKGTDIMLNTIFALVITFTSYVFLSFLVNDVLKVEEKYQLQSECRGPSSRGQTCNATIGPNYVCDDSGNCITRCEEKNLTDPPQDWRCVDVPDVEAFMQAYGSVYSGDIATGLCPGGEKSLCILFVDNKPRMSIPQH
jgi:hypothetical protein